MSYNAKMLSRWDCFAGFRFPAIHTKGWWILFPHPSLHRRNMAYLGFHKVYIATQAHLHIINSLLPFRTWSKISLESWASHSKKEKNVGSRRFFWARRCSSSSYHSRQREEEGCKAGCWNTRRAYSNSWARNEGMQLLLRAVFPLSVLATLYFSLCFMRWCLLQTIDAYELSEKLSGHQLDEKEVERIAEDFIREQATLEFVDDTVCKIASCARSS